jgi:GntR family transcriptional regulator
MNTLRAGTPPPVPLHRQLADRLRGEIGAGVWPPGAQLPSEHELAARFGVARGTVRHALSSLRAEGAIAVRKGARRVVVGTPRTQGFETLLSFSAWALALGEEPGGRVVELARHPASEAEAGSLGIAAGAPVFRLVRVRLLSGAPVMIERTTFSERVGRLVASLDLETDSIYARLAERGVLFAAADHTISAIPATASDAALLGVARRTPLLRQERRTAGPDGTPLEWSDDRYRGDAVSFALHNSAAAPKTIGRLVTDGTTDLRR